MPLTFSSFAVAGGAGGLGSLITKELLAQGAKVTVLSRSETTKVPEGASVRAVDYSNAEDLVKALEGHDVLVSALNAGGFPSQPALVDAAKKAGIKHVVPSEFGAATHDVTPDSLLFHKRQIQERLRSLELPYTLYYTGWFSDYDFIPPFGFDAANKTLNIVGDGTQKISFTRRPDVAQFVAYTITHLPVEQLKNKTFHVEGDKKTLLEVKDTFEKVYGGPFTVNHRKIPEVEAIVKEKGAAAFLDFVLLGGAYGTTNLETNDNKLVPGFQPLDVEQALRKHFT